MERTRLNPKGQESVFGPRTSEQARREGREHRALGTVGYNDCESPRGLHREQWYPGQRTERGGGDQQNCENALNLDGRGMATAWPQESQERAK